VPANVAEIEVGARGFVRRRVDAAAARAGAEPIVLQRWPRYALRLVDERGEPLAGWLVSLMPRYEGSTTTNERGVVAVGAKTFAAPRLLVSPPGTAEQAVVPLPWPASATPGAACDVVVPDILVATASVYGVVVAPDGTSIADAHAELRSPAGLLFAMQRAPGGEFHFAHVPAGDWQLWIQRGNRHVFDPPVPITLAKGEDCDAGVIRAPAEGSLRVTVRTASGRRPAGLRFLLDNTHGEDTDFPVDGQHHELPAGTYRWIAVVEDACWRAGDVEVRASERRELEVVLPPGSRRDLFIALPGAGLAEGFVDWSLRADDGMLAYRERTPMTVEDRIELHPNLSPGTWHVDVAAGDGRRFTGSFEIAALGPSPAAIHVALTAVR
jgi:hypothetical protein